VTDIQPRSGTVAGGALIRINGHGFTGNPSVLFDGRLASVVTVGDSQVVVRAPSHPQSAIVDVRVSVTGRSVLLVRGFSYVPVSGPPPWYSSGGSPPTTAPPAGGGPTTIAPGVTPPAPSPTMPAAPVPVPARFGFGGVATTRGALHLRRVDGSSPLMAYPAPAWPGRRCAVAVCTGTKL
jgi:hypothetical protein